MADYVGTAGADNFRGTYYEDAFYFAPATYPLPTSS
jgi:hypothetical protein